jgi:hypothetical protein
MKLTLKYSWLPFSLLLLLLVISVFKDDITPDYRNTPNAAFLSPETLQSSRISTLLTHPLFWLSALIYTILFTLLPTLIIKFTFQQKSLTAFTSYVLGCISILLYLAIFANSPLLDQVVVSKVNRYLHSPILVLFLWAAYTLTTSIKHDE